MNVREGARRIRLIAQWLISLGILAAVIDTVAIAMNPRNMGVLPWHWFLVPGFALAMLAWVVDGFGMPVRDDSQKDMGQTEVRPV